MYNNLYTICILMFKTSFLLEIVMATALHVIRLCCRSHVCRSQPVGVKVGWKWAVCLYWSVRILALEMGRQHCAAHAHIWPGASEPLTLWYFCSTESSEKTTACTPSSNTARICLLCVCSQKDLTPQYNGKRLINTEGLSLSTCYILRGLESAIIDSRTRDF